MTASQEAPYRFGLSTFQLKWIAIVTMLIDHIGMVLFPGVTWLRAIGRLSFPIFCFVLVEGFYHTHDRRNYLIRLGLFALISEVPFDLARSGVFIDPERQNVFFTLFLGFAMLCGIREFKAAWEQVAVVLVNVSFAALFSVDYGAQGVLLILVYAVFRDYQWPKLILGALWNFLFRVRTQYFGVFSMFPLALYNGEKGRSMKWFFYIFYPAHLLLLVGIKRLFF